MKVNFFYLFLSVVFLMGCDSQPPVQVLNKNAVIVAFGDSLTFGHGVNPEDSYPAVLEKMTGRTVINAGISGEVSSDGLLRLPGIIAEHSPQLIIICHGANDILRNQSMQVAESNLRAMVKMARDKNIDVVLVAVPGFNLMGTPPAFYKAIASDFNIPFEPDIIGDLEKTPSMKSDSVHFNKAGYSEIAKAVFNLLTKADAFKTS